MKKVPTHCQNCNLEKVLNAVTTIVHFTCGEQSYILPVANYLCAACLSRDDNYRQASAEGKSKSTTSRHVKVSFCAANLNFEIESAGRPTSTITTKPLIWQALGLKS